MLFRNQCNTVSVAILCAFFVTAEVLFLRRCNYWRQVLVYVVVDDVVVFFSSRLGMMAVL